MASGPERFIDGLLFPEGLRWHAGDLWFSDFNQRRVFSADQMARSASTRSSVRSRPGSALLRPAKRWLSGCTTATC